MPNDHHKGLVSGNERCGARRPHGIAVLQNNGHIHEPKGWNKLGFDQHAQGRMGQTTALPCRHTSLQEHLLIHQVRSGSVSAQGNTRISSRNRESVSGRFCSSAETETLSSRGEREIASSLVEAHQFLLHGPPQYQITSIPLTQQSH